MFNHIVGHAMKDDSVIVPAQHFNSMRPKAFEEERRSRGTFTVRHFPTHHHLGDCDSPVAASANRATSASRLTDQAWRRCSPPPKTSFGRSSRIRQIIEAAPA
jgi:hypothetical protein